MQKQNLFGKLLLFCGLQQRPQFVKTSCGSWTDKYSKVNPHNPGRATWCCSQYRERLQLAETEEFSYSSTCFWKSSLRTSLPQFNYNGSPLQTSFLTPSSWDVVSVFFYLEKDKRKLSGSKITH